MTTAESTSRIWESSIISRQFTPWSQIL